MSAPCAVIGYVVIYLLFNYFSYLVMKVSVILHSQKVKTIGYLLILDKNAPF
jgi:hypothetical protein